MAKWPRSKTCVFSSLLFVRYNSYKRNNRTASHWAHLVSQNTRGNVGVAFSCWSVRFQLSFSPNHLCVLVFKLVISSFTAIFIWIYPFTHFMKVFIFSTCSLLDSKYKELVTTFQKMRSKMHKRDECSSCNTLRFVLTASSSAATRPLACCRSVQ